MARLFELSDQEVAAIWSYLGTVPRIRNPRRPSEPYPLRADAGEGEKRYYKYSCHTCHGDSGAGACDLRGAHLKYRGDAELEAWIRDPAKLMPESKMPSFQGVIAEADYAPLVSYVRQLGGMR
jgi:mono/diheme cytochrome c family protein